MAQAPLCLALWAQASTPGWLPWLPRSSLTFSPAPIYGVQAAAAVAPPPAWSTGSHPHIINSGRQQCNCLPGCRTSSVDAGCRELCPQTATNARWECQSFSETLTSTKSTYKAVFGHPTNSEMYLKCIFYYCMCHLSVMLCSRKLSGGSANWLVKGIVLWTLL